MESQVSQIINEALKKAKFQTKINIQDLVETPRDKSNGDYAFPCFLLAKELKKSPHQIANELMKEIGQREDLFENIEVAGPYINFFVNRFLLAEKTISEIIEKKDKYGFNTIGEGKKIMIEFPSPNTNKPLHLGHLRNMTIGDSVSKIAKANGFSVVKSSINNDRGIHICKSMLAYEKWGNKKTPESENKKSDHFVGDFYVKFAKELKRNPDLEDQAQHMLQKWESQDPKTIKLWEKMRNWALEGFLETYKIFGIEIDKEYFESQIYKEGKDIILKGLRKGIFKKRDDGAIVFELDDGETQKVLLRADGTSIYITQDIYLAKKKFKDYKLDKSIYVTGNEQDYHFKILFEILEKLNISPKEKLKHLSYGMVLLPEGKMKSREGTVVDADDLIRELHEIVKRDLKKRYKLKEDELNQRALKIALASLKYMLLKMDIRKNMTFNPKESVSFEGDTGPYLQYAYARASSILSKIDSLPESELPDKIINQERALIMKLSEFKQAVLLANNSMNPSIIANYSFDLAKAFSEFYHECPVINSKYKNFRLHLVNAFAQVIKNSLNLLGIEVVEEM